ncbi:MAG: hypothetical protein JKY52_15140 [Flavobacteriales bacterium]|nr:hypothetical protein [Flavobacteriales bacterium]
MEYCRAGAVWGKLRFRLNFKVLWLLGLWSLFDLSSVKGQLGIGTITPDPSAILHMVDAQRGMIISNMTTVQRDAIVAPASSLMVFNTTDQCFQAYVNGKWQNTFCNLQCSVPPATPGVITGNTSPCENATGVTYFVNQIPGATSYVWAIPSGSTIAAGQGTTGIVVDYGTTVGMVDVTAINACGASATQTLAISLQAPPAQPSTITGNTAVCQGDNAVAYSVSNVAGVTYSWTYSGTGFTCATACASNSITANFSAGATSGTLTITPSDACGSGTVQTLAITVNSVPVAPTVTAATNITTIGLDANWNASSGATIYYLDLDDNSDFSSPLGGYNNLNVGNVVTYNVTGLSCGTTYYYRVRAGNSCGTSGNSGTITIVTSTCIPTCGTQIWAITNLNVGTRINGAPSGQNMSSPGGDEKYCYNDIEANCTTYGGLYEWNEMMDYAASINCDPCGGTGVRGICPAGYHIPTDLEWSRYEWCVENTLAPTGSTALATFQTTTGFRGTASTAGPGAKMKDDIGWNGSNTSNFSALPLGSRIHNTGAFADLGTLGVYWTATTQMGLQRLVRIFDTTESRSERNSRRLTTGAAVRCLQD